MRRVARAATASARAAQSPAHAGPVSFSASHAPATMAAASATSGLRIGRSLSAVAATPYRRRSMAFSARTVPRINGSAETGLPTARFIHASGVSLPWLHMRSMFSASGWERK